MARNFAALAGLLLLTLAGCGADAGLGGDLPNSAPVVDIRNSGCVGGPACNTQYEWQTAKCEELPVSGLPLGRCWMTKRYAGVANNVQLFEAVSPGEGNTHIYFARNYGYGSQFTTGTPAADFVRSFAVIR